MKTLDISRFRPQDFDLHEDHFRQLNDRTILVKKWDWDYQTAHAFQRHCLTLSEETPQLRTLIVCNHPQVFTHGRGLQKAKKGEELPLIDFNPEVKLPFPLHRVERGGGLTFHHPGQFIFYPIVKLNPKTLSLSTMIDDIFEAAQATLTSWGLSDLSHEHKLLGLWWKDRKLASMGIAIERLTTFHGMALNLFKDEEMKEALQRLNPCGLKSETYTSVDELIDLEGKSLEDFSHEFLRRLIHAWK